MTRSLSSSLHALLLVATVATLSVVAQEPALFRPKLAIPEVVAPFLDYLDPGNDAFATEREAAELEQRLRELGNALRGGTDRVAGFAGSLLASTFRGARLLAPSSTQPSEGKSSFEVVRSTDLPRELSIPARAFGAELRQLIDEMREVTVAELLITSIAFDKAANVYRTDVRYDIVGSGSTTPRPGSGQAWRVEHVGVWRLSWRKTAAGWQVVDWNVTSHVTSRARTAPFTEVTEAALGANESFVRQLRRPLDEWSARLDSVLARDSNGHHGVSIGDADGDGLDDLYIAQPAGLPNRLYRARGDATFEDMTDRAGVGVLDDTAQSLFADIDNDGDQDLVLATSVQPLLFVNDGSGKFSPIANAFRFERPLQGVLTSIAMADYDRDGFLDLYLCVYSYFFGAGEDKAGTPAPYYDARNGPPGVLFRNDRQGHFVDATREVGLDAGNDRYHFAAAWADYDGNGWPDLLVANDFGAKNLYRNLGTRDGKVTFQDVAKDAGVLDYGAGMSAAFFDYDNDGLLDIYTGNMWSDAGQRVTGSPSFMPDASPEVRELYRRHARGNALFRNRGDGRFEERTLQARVEMGRWAWSSDALDFDNDGWEDLYVVNGMLTREGSSDEARRDLDGFFWRQVVARSPLTHVKSTSYDDGWRAINQLLIHGSIASHQRNVLFRNDGKGGFDEVSGAAGLDLDQDGRSFATFDMDRDGDQDLVVMAARQAPQVRIFLNNAGNVGLAIGLTGTKSNRDAIGARVTIETDQRRRTKIVQAGSGFLSQRSRELLFGLGPSGQVRKITVDWPSGEAQTFTDIPSSRHLRLIEGGKLEATPVLTKRNDPAASTRTAATTLPDETWLYEPFPAPDFSASDRQGQTRSLAALRGKPAVILLWSSTVGSSRPALDALARGEDALARAGIGSIPIAVDTNRDAGLSYTILYRHLFMNRQTLRLPTALLLDAEGRVVKVYRDGVDVARIVRDARAIEVGPVDRLSRAVPFAGTFYSPPPRRNYLPYGRELLDQGLEGAAIVAFERAASASPSAPTLYRLGTLLGKAGETARARDAFERALALQPDLAEANNDLGALVAQTGDLDAAIARFRAALASMPDYPDALNNLGYALLLTGNDAEARTLYERALALQPDFPEALNNLGLLAGRGGDLDRAERLFREAMTRRPGYGDAINNLSLVLVARGQSDIAVKLLQELIDKNPTFENAYITLAKLYFQSGHLREGLAILERLLQRNPKHPVGLELVRQYKTG
jgi:Flp pilus assembly protein TadD